MLVATAVLMMILVLMVSITGHTSDVIRKAGNRLDEFQEATTAFENVVRHVGMATLASRTELLTANGTKVSDWGDRPGAWGRYSDLMFVSGPAADLGLPGEAVTHGIFFQALLGDGRTLAATNRLNNALNEVGYALLRRPPAGVPGFVNATNTFQLVEFRKRPDNVTVYQAIANANAQTNQALGLAWFQPPAGTNWSVEPLANQILAFVVQPLRRDDQGFEDISPNSYLFNSRTPSAGAADFLHRLPDALRITMVAASENAVRRAGLTTDTFLQGLFEEPDKYDANLTTLTTRLDAAKIPHRVYSSIVRPWEAKSR